MRKPISQTRKATIHSRSGQAAMEFLMTYGWVLLVILVITAGLAYFDVFNPSLFLPERCSLGYRVGCVDFLFTDSAASFQVFNSFSDDMVISRVNISSASMTGWCSQDMVIPIRPGESTPITFPCPEFSTVNERGNFVLNTEIYFWLNSSGSTYVYPIYGDLYTRIN